MQEQKQKRILFSLCYVNENHQMIINDLLYKGQKVIERVYVTGGITLRVFFDDTFISM